MAQLLAFVEFSVALCVARACSGRAVSLPLWLPCRACISNRAEAWRIKVQVSVAEAGHRAERLRVRDGQPIAPPNDEAGFAEVPHHPVDVHGGQAERPANLFLRQRDLERAAVALANGFQSGRQLAQEMSDPFAPATSPQARRMFAEHDVLDCREAAKCIAKCRIMLEEFVHLGMRDRHDRAIGQRADSLIRRPDVKIINIQHVARQQYRGRLL